MKRFLITVALAYVVLIAVSAYIVLSKQSPMPVAPSYLPEVRQ